MIYAVTCADDNYMPCARFQMETAKKYGKADKTVIYNLNEIEASFREKNARILEAGGTRRKGCYLWKPYFLNKAMNHLQTGDYMVYLDAAGNYYRSKISETVRYMEKNNIEIVCSRKNSYQEKHWTKRDAFILMGCDTEAYAEQTQCYGGFLLVKKTAHTMEILRKWLEYAQDYRIITDAPNTCGAENYDGFCEHRFDQSILSLLLAKYDVAIMEKLPVPDFYVYHHTTKTSIKAVRKELRSRQNRIIKTYLEKKDYKGIYYVKRDRLLETLWIQRIQRRRQSTIV